MGSLGIDGRDIPIAGNGIFIFGRLGKPGISGIGGLGIPGIEGMDIPIAGNGIFIFGRLGKPGISGIGGLGIPGIDGRDIPIAGNGIFIFGNDGKLHLLIAYFTITEQLKPFPGAKGGTQVDIGGPVNDATAVTGWV